MLTLLLMLSMMIPVEAKTPSEFAAERDGLIAFRTFLEAPSNKADCLSRVQIIFHSPYAHGELVSRGLDRPNKKLEVDKGTFDFNVVAGGELINFNLPFWFVEDARGTQFYFTWDDKWKKVAFNDINLNDLDSYDPSAILAIIDRAVLLNDAGGQRIIRVELSGAKLAELLESVPNDQNDPNDPQLKRREKFAQTFRAALLKTGTLGIDFSLNKETNQPLMIACDMTPLLSNLFNAFAVGSTPSSPGEGILSGVFNGLASTSQLQMYVICEYADKFDDDEFKLPRSVRRAKDITDDLLAVSKVKAESASDKNISEE